MKFVVEVHFLDSYNQDSYIEFDNYAEARDCYSKTCEKYLYEDDVFVSFSIFG